jgi:hypothetical protein
MKASPSRAGGPQQAAAITGDRRTIPPANTPATRWLGLQRVYGNRVVQRLLATAVQSETDAPPQVQESIRRTQGGGKEMAAGVRLQMESAFGADFGQVRLHTDTNADILNRTLSAVAFTIGRDIYFREGRYDPDGADGRRLLAHELTHVTQQAGGTADGNIVVGPPGNVYEQEADQMAEAVMHTASPQSPSESPGGHAPGPAIQRMCDHCEEESRHPSAGKKEEEER